MYDKYADTNTNIKKLWLDYDGSDRIEKGGIEGGGGYLCIGDIGRFFFLWGMFGRMVWWFSFFHYFLSPPPFSFVFFPFSNPPVPSFALIIWKALLSWNEWWWLGCHNESTST